MAGAKNRKDRVTNHHRKQHNKHHLHNNDHLNKTTSTRAMNDQQHEGHHRAKDKNDDNNVFASSDCSNDGVFPSWTAQVVWVVCSVWRVWYVTQPDNWWLLHPDENFQSLEVAHTQVYGFGFRPYEFSSLAHSSVGGAGNDSVSLYRQRELQLGMHGMRSALYPFFYVIVSWVASVLCLDVKPFVLWKVAHAAVSSLLPLSVYSFTKAYFRSHDASCMAAILVAISTHLNVLGTHPLLNSFLAPAVFWALSRVVLLVSGECWSSLQTSNNDADEPRDCDVQNSASGQIKAENLSNGMKGGTAERKIVGECYGKGHTETESLSKCQKAEIPRSPSLRCCDDNTVRLGLDADIDSSPLRQNGDVPHLNGTVSNGVVKAVEKDCHCANTHQNGKLAPPMINAKQTAFTRCQPRVVFESSGLVSLKTTLLNLLSGFVLALCVYTRVDIALFSAVTLFPRFGYGLASYRALAVCSLGASLGMVCGVWQDYWFYNELVLSPQNWAMFNVFRDLSGDFFGKASFCRYIELLFGHSPGLPALVVGSVAILLSSVLVQAKRYLCKTWSEKDHSTRQSEESVRAQDCSRLADQSNYSRHLDHEMSHSCDVGLEESDNNNNNNNNSQKGHSISNTTNNKLEVNCTKDGKTTNPTTSSSQTNTSEYNLAVTLTFTWVLLLLLYSSKEHKELRFLYNIIVLMLISCASVLLVTLKALAQNLGFHRRNHLAFMFCIFLALFAADQWNSFPSSKDRSHKPWAYQRTDDSHDVNACLNYVSDQSDVTGVFLDSNFYVTAGFTLLHKDVPVFTYLVHEFVEFDNVSSKMDTGKPSVLDGLKNVSYVTLDRLSNFVSVQNSAYLAKLLIQKRHYNYFILAKQTKFLQVGFREVFAHGIMRVLRRTFDPAEERQLSMMASRSPLGVNATVLKYEGDVLFRFNRLHLALERYMAAVKLDSEGPQIFQGIAACKQKLGEQQEARKWIQACVQRFGASECSQPLSITNINPDRGLF